MECLRKIGIDVEMGLKRVGNKEYLYIKLLKSFVSGTLYQSLQNSINAAYLEKIIAAAHSLKGVCANLAINELRQLASDIEKQAKNGSMEAVEETFAQFSIEYYKVAAVIKDYDSLKNEQETDSAALLHLSHKDIM